jgi:hypothetical protein
METTKKKSKLHALIPASAETIEAAYCDYLLSYAKQPATIFKFCKDNGITENEFYTFFASFEALEKSIWTSYIEQTILRLESDNNYGAFSSREKILTFYFSLVELLKTNRSFVLHQLKDWKNPVMLPTFLKGFKISFNTWISNVINQGKQSGEISKRPYLDEQYHNVFWLHLVFILQFWIKDDSAGFEKTDIAIEKSVNLAFDLIGKGVLDSAIDFGKFLYQTSKN